MSKQLMKFFTAGARKSAQSRNRSTTSYNHLDVLSRHSFRYIWTTIIVYRLQREPAVQQLHSTQTLFIECSTEVYS